MEAPKNVGASKYEVENSGEVLYCKERFDKFKQEWGQHNIEKCEEFVRRLKSVTYDLNKTVEYPSKFWFKYAMKKLMDMDKELNEDLI